VESVPLAKLRAHALEQIKRLPRSLLSLKHAPEYPVAVSEGIRNLARQIDATQGQANPQTTTRRRFALMTS
jgi:nicotinate phosphoribosyltransferase